MQTDMFGNSRRGKFIVFEGTDGAGKTTQAGLVRDRLKIMGLQVELYREPGSTLAGEELRDLIKSNTIPLNSYAQLCVIMASRAQLIGEVINPKLESGTTILLDRYLPSTIAYRPDIPRYIIDQMTKLLNFPDPDLYIFLTADSSIVLNRAAEKSPDRFDHNVQDNLARIDFYETLRKEFNGVRISSNGSISTTSDLVMSNILCIFDNPTIMV